MKPFSAGLPVLSLALSFAAAQEPPASDPALQRALREVRVVREADAVVLGRVLRVHASPGIWCGTLVTKQEVTWRVERVVHGEEKGVAGVGSEITVGHLLVAGSPLVSEHAPFLRTDRIHPGARALLFLERDEELAPMLRDEAFSVRLLDPPRAIDLDHWKLLRLVFALPGLQPYLHLDEPDRLPVRIRLDEVMAVPLEGLVVGRRTVEFLPGELMRGRPHFVFPKIEKTAEGSSGRSSSRG
jgi:hypothetical protein